VNYHFKTTVELVIASHFYINWFYSPSCR